MFKEKTIWNYTHGATMFVFKFWYYLCLHIKIRYVYLQNKTKKKNNSPFIKDPPGQSWSISFNKSQFWFLLTSWNEREKRDGQREFIEAIQRANCLDPSIWYSHSHQVYLFHCKKIFLVLSCLEEWMASLAIEKEQHGIVSCTVVGWQPR